MDEQKSLPEPIDGNSLPTRPNEREEGKYKLLDCPLCGGETKLITTGNDSTKKRSATVRCLTCGCGLTVGAIRFNLEWAVKTVIEKWNLRQVKVELDEAKTLIRELRQDLSIAGVKGSPPPVEGLKTMTETISELRAKVKRYAEALTKPKHCEECGDTGTVARHVCNGNEEVCSRRCPEPEPCEICWTDPNSLFQVIQSALSALSEGTDK